MVANGIAMQRIMEATQEETRTSRVLAIRAHELTEEMKKDSLSMKTVGARFISYDSMLNKPDCRFDHVLPTTNIICCEIPQNSMLWS
jgi:hypothetical protein